MAAIDDRQTSTKTASKPITGADVLVESLARHGVEVVFAYPGRREHADAPGADALSRPDPDDPAAARARGHLRGRGIRPRHAASRAW